MYFPIILVNRYVFKILSFTDILKFIYHYYLPNIYIIIFQYLSYSIIKYGVSYIESYLTPLQCFHTFMYRYYSFLKKLYFVHIKFYVDQLFLLRVK